MPIAASTFLLMCAEFLFIFAHDYSWYIVIALLTGTGFAFASGAMEALVYDSLPETDRENAMKRAMGRVNSWGQIAFVIAPIIGGIIIGDASEARFIPAIALTVAALLVGLLFCLTLQEPAKSRGDQGPGSMALFRSGIRLLRQNPRLRRLTLLVIFSSPFTATMVTTLGPPYLTRNEVSPFVVGLTLSAGSLLAALTQRYAWKLEQWLGQARAIALLILLPGALYWLLAATAGPFASVLIIALMYGGNDMKAPLFSAYQNALISSENRATALSLINMFVSLYLALAEPIFAALGEHSLDLAFVALGAVIVCAGLTLRPPQNQA